jgi:hypothetical protein
MLNSQKFILYGMNLLFDAMLLFLFYVLLLQGASWLDFALYAAVLLPIIAFSGALYIFKPNLLKLTLACTVLISTLLFWFITSSILLSAILAGILTWRSTENWQDPLKTDLEIILTINAVFALILSFFFKDGFTVMYGAVWIQFMLMLGIKMTVHYFKNSDAEKVWKDFSVPLALVALSNVIFAFLVPIKQFIYWVLDGVLFLMYYIVAVPLWKLFSLLAIPIAYLIKLFKKEEEEGKSELGVVEEILEQEPQELLSTNYTLLWWTAVALLVIIVLIYIWRKKLLFNFRADAVLTGNVSALTSSDLNGSAFGKRKWLQSKDRTRKKFLHFEKVMDKRGYARHPGESATLWFERLKLFGKEAESVLHAYEKVRYGDEKITNEEFNLYAKAIKKLERSEHLQKKKSE